MHFALNYCDIKQLHLFISSFVEQIMRSTHDDWKLKQETLILNGLEKSWRGIFHTQTTSCILFYNSGQEEAYLTTPLEGSKIFSSPSNNPANEKVR